MPGLALLTIKCLDYSEVTTSRESLDVLTIWKSSSSTGCPKSMGNNLNQIFHGPYVQMQRKSSHQRESYLSFSTFLLVLPTLAAFKLLTILIWTPCRAVVSSYRPVFASFLIVCLSSLSRQGSANRRPLSTTTWRCQFLVVWLASFQDCDLPLIGLLVHSIFGSISWSECPVMSRLVK